MAVITQIHPDWIHVEYDEERDGSLVHFGRPLRLGEFVLPIEPRDSRLRRFARLFTRHLSQRGVALGMGFGLFAYSLVQNYHVNCISTGTSFFTIFQHLSLFGVYHFTITVFCNHSDLIFIFCSVVNYQLDNAISC